MEKGKTIKAIEASAKLVEKDSSYDSSIIYAKHVVKHYYKKDPIVLPDGTRLRKTVIRAVDEVDLTVKKGEIVGVLGETGCGKSTLGRVLAGLEMPTHGAVMLDHEPMQKLFLQDYRALRRRAQMVFQNPFDAFDVRHTMERTLTDTLKLHGIGADHKERVAIASKALEEADIAPAQDFMRRYPSELSGGQLQRIAIVRSMLLNPEFVVADEPVSMLDVSIRADIINMLHDMAKERGTAMVFISHDISTTRYIADRIAVMYLGEIVELGETDDVICRPMHPYTQALISNCPSANPLRRFSPVRLEGDPPSAAVPQSGCRFADRCQKATQECHRRKQELVKAEDGKGHFVRCAVIMGE